MSFTKSLTLNDGEISLSDYGNVLVMKCLREVNDEYIAKKACETTGLNLVTRITYDGLAPPYSLSRSDLEAVNFACKHMNNLKDFNLANAFELEDSWFLEIGKLLQQRCLPAVHLSGSAFAMEQLLIALTKSKCSLNHEHVMLSRLYLMIGMTDECVSNVCALIKSGHASHLQVLDLSFNQITSSGISKICEVLNAVLCGKLTYMNLSFNPIGDEGVVMLRNALIQGQCCKLSKLFLDSCSLTAETMRYLCDVLCMEHCKLDELSFADNAIGDEAVRMLGCNALRKKQCKLIY
jgi:hypothetical protein